MAQTRREAAIKEVGETGIGTSGKIEELEEVGRGIGGDRDMNKGGLMTAPKKKKRGRPKKSGLAGKR